MFEILKLSRKQYGEAREIELLDAHLAELYSKSPVPFCKFYSNSNGWKLDDSDSQLTYKLSRKFGTRESLSFDFMLSIADIFDEYSSREGVSFPEGTIPFIDVEEGEIVISVREDSFGKVYFCESNPTNEQMPEDSFEDSMSKFDPSKNILPGIVMELEDSFENFIDSLVLEKWDK
jgi:hypothetical protein